MEKLGNAEIEKLGLSHRGNQDVARFQIAVDHQILMGILNGAADFLENPEAFRDGKIVFNAVAGNWEAIDRFHNEVRNPLLGASHFIKLRNVWVIQVGENLDFLLKAPLDLRNRMNGPQELDGYLPLEFLIGSGGEIYGPHAATSEFPDDPVSPDGTTFWGGCRIEESKGRSFEKGDSIQIDGQKGIDFPPETFISGTSIVQIGMSVSEGEFPDNGKNLPDPFPSAFVHCSLRGPPVPFLCKGVNWL